MTAPLCAISPLLPLGLLAAAGVLVLAVWLYLWLFHHRFWTTRIPPVGTAITDLPQPTPSAAQPAPANATRTEFAQSGSIPSDSALPASLPPVLVVIPARNEAEVIARTVTDVLLQSYNGALHLVVVNDNSQDATAALADSAARTALAALPPERAALRRFDIINGSPLPAGWSGKLWAVEQGIRHGLGSADYAENAAPCATCNTSAAHTANAVQSPSQPQSARLTAADTTHRPQYIWLTDADISHRPQVLQALLARAITDRRAMVSRMALLCTDTAAERWTIPAFVYFFQMLYPFAAIANERTPIDGAAGGCILLERESLQKIGGISSLRGALIDDCTLAAHVARTGGRLWLELTKDSVSQRGYGGAEGVSNMIARTAYTQLHYSPLRLIGTVFGLVFTFFCPLLLPLVAAVLLLSTTTVTATTLLPACIAIAASLTAAAIMFGTFIPMLRFYKLNPLRALALPLVASFYLSATVKSALRHYRGKTGNWKGRVYQNG